MSEHPKKDYSVVLQGVVPLHNPDKADVDLVVVPGLGAHPRDSWKSTDSKGFNWIVDKDGICRDLPTARILLFEYESAWIGSIKVKQFLPNIAAALLSGLLGLRQDCKRRPIVFIGHSMGGLVIAKAVCLAETKRGRFPAMFESFAGSIFFGTPFHGAAVAMLAVMFSHVGSYFDKTTSSSLLDMMKPDPEPLNELRMDFARLVYKVHPKIDLMCYYEQRPTDPAKTVGLGSGNVVANAFNSLVPKIFVTRESATLEGAEQLGLAANHRNLVKFSNVNDANYKFVRDEVKKMVRNAPLTAKARHNAFRNVDFAAYSKILRNLEEGFPVKKKREALKKTLVPSTWLPEESIFQNWLGKTESIRRAGNAQSLWIRGSQGRGKTAAAIAALENVDRHIRTEQAAHSDQAPLVVAYYLCDTSAEGSSAEELLTSLVGQMLSQQEALISHLSSFTAESGAQKNAQKSVENLWSWFENMIKDDCVGGIYIVISNIHLLQEESESTEKFLHYLRRQLLTSQAPSDHRVPVRWLLTSRNTIKVRTALESAVLDLIDLEDTKYESQVQIELRKHAQRKITELRVQKNYTKALAYFASSLIGKRAQNTQWIDIICERLADLSGTDNAFEIRRVLENIPQDLTVLLNQCWTQVLNELGDDGEKVKEMLRVLSLSFEDPTDAELAVLTGLSNTRDDRRRIREWAAACKPLLNIKRTGIFEYRVSFLSEIVKAHLQENASIILGLSDEEKQWQHGIITFRCYDHLYETLKAVESNFMEVDLEEPERPTLAVTAASVPPSKAASAKASSEVGSDVPADGVAQQADETSIAGAELPLGAENNREEAHGFVGDPEASEAGNEDENEVADANDGESSEAEPNRDDAPTAEEESDVVNEDALPYDLSLEADFWRPRSQFRLSWVNRYADTTDVFEDFEELDKSLLTGLHVAAAFGFSRLVAALIKNGHANEINIRENMSNTPLHFAANFGRSNTLEELLNAGASYDDGIETNDQTPLGMAASDGRVNIVKKLLEQGADPTAEDSEGHGTVLANAIVSGNREIVDLIVARKPPITPKFETNDHPLAIAASFSDLDTFSFLADQYQDELDEDHYFAAMYAAAYKDRPEILEVLLEQTYTDEQQQTCLDAAAEQESWNAAELLLRKLKGLNCDNAFIASVDGVQQQDRILAAIQNHRGGVISPETINSCLYSAADKEKYSTVHMLIENFKADPNLALGKEYGDALTASAYDGTLEIAKLPLAAGAQVDSQDGRALQTAAAQGHDEMVRLLLEHSADVNRNVVDERHPSALLGATISGLLTTVELLLEHGADVNLGTSVHYPVIAASRISDGRILEKLIEKKVELNILGGPDKSTPLIEAAAMLPWHYSEMMLDAGAEIDLQDEQGDTALIMAASAGDDDLVRCLLGRGADITISNESGKNALQAAVFLERSDCISISTDHVSAMLVAFQSAIKEGAPDLQVALVAASKAAALSGLAQKIDSVAGDVAAVDEHAEAATDSNSNTEGPEGEVEMGEMEIETDGDGRDQVTRPLEEDQEFFDTEQQEEAEEQESESLPELSPERNTQQKPRHRNSP